MNYINRILLLAESAFTKEKDYWLLRNKLNERKLQDVVDLIKSQIDKCAKKLRDSLTEEERIKIKEQVEHLNKLFDIANEYYDFNIRDDEDFEDEYFE